MTFKSEAEFENALINLLVSEKGWQDGVLKYKTRKTESVRKLDSSTLRLLNNYIANASLAMAFGLSNMSAQSVLGGADTLRQDVHITAEFPNATNSQEIEDAFDSLINRAAQFITTKN